MQMLNNETSRAISWPHKICRCIGVGSRQLAILLIVAALAEVASSASTVKLDNSFTQLGPSGGGLIYSDFALEVSGWMDASPSVDSDLRAKGLTSAITNVNPSAPLSASKGIGTIRVVDGLMTEIKFQYGQKGDLHFNPDVNPNQVFGGFTGYVKSKYFGHATPQGVNTQNTAIAHDFRTVAGRCLRR